MNSNVSTVYDGYDSIVNNGRFPLIKKRDIATVSLFFLFFRIHPLTRQKAQALDVPHLLHEEYGLGVQNGRLPQTKLPPQAVPDPNHQVHRHAPRQ